MAICNILLRSIQKTLPKLSSTTRLWCLQIFQSCIGLDIHMLDPSTSRTLRIYPLDTVTRCDVTDSSTFAFWSKSSVDIEPRRIRLLSNRYTINTILDTVTAATIQVPDEAVTKCTACGSDFSAFVRRHHCRNCGDIFCDKCTHGRIALTADENAPQVRVCDRCMAEVYAQIVQCQGSSIQASCIGEPRGSGEEASSNISEEMERNRKSSSGYKSDGSGKRMKEVACPTCTVHLQVQVPSSGSETIECGVCQHPFLVSVR